MGYHRPGRPRPLFIFELVFTRSHSGYLSDSHACCHITSYVQEKAYRQQEPFLLGRAQREAHSLIPASPVLCPSIRVVSDD